MKKIILFCLLLLPGLTLAADFVPLVGIPGLTGNPAENFSDYINAVYRLSISIAALIAVVKIIGAGVKYMFSDIVTSKSAAIADIRSSLLGLLVVIGAVLILSTVNEDLTNFTVSLGTVVIEDPGSLPDGVIDFSEVTSRAEYCQAADRANLTCIYEEGWLGGGTGTGSGFDLYSQNMTFQEFCQSPEINGFFEDGYVITNDGCTYTAEGLQDYIDGVTMEAESTACSNLGSGSCTRLFCSGILKDSESCQTECGTLGGGYYNFPPGYYGGDDICMVPDNLIEPLDNNNSAPYVYSGYTVRIWPGWENSYNGYVLVEYLDTISPDNNGLVDCTQIIGSNNQPLCD